MRRRETHRQKLNPNREGDLQGKALSRDLVQKDHSREGHRNKVRALLGRDQNQGKDPLFRDPDKVRAHQVKGPNQVKDLLVRDPGKARGLNQVKHLQDKDLLLPSKGRGPNQIKVLPVKDLLGRRRGKVRDHQDNKHPNQARMDLRNLPSKDNKAQGLILGNLERLLVLLVHKELVNQQVASAHCVRPPS